MTRGFHISSAAEALGRYLPSGRFLPEDAWRRRHRALLALLWLHVPALAGYAVIRGYGVGHAAVEAGLVAAPALAAALTGRFEASRRVRGLLVAAGLLTCSALVVHLAEGTIEAHFHFFVVMSLLLLYEEWLTFLLAVGYVVVHHGVAGTLASGTVYNHPDAIAHPWKWAAIHAAFVAAASAANVTAWSLNENVRRDARDARRRAENSERLFRAAFEDAPIGVGFAALDGRWLHVNAAMCTLLGKSQYQLLNETVGANTHPDDARVEAQQQQRLIDGEIENYQLEKRLRQPDRTWGWALVTVSLARNADGTPSYFIRQGQDITPLKAAEDSVRAAEQRYRTLVEQLPLVIYLDNGDDRSSNVYTSPQVTEMLGYAPDEWVADPDLFVKTLHPDDRERVLRESAAANETGAPFSSEYRLVARDGRHVWVRDRALPVYVEDAGATMYQGYLLDITHEKQLEEQARQSQKMEAVGQLAGGIAHDFNNLLTAIQGYCSLAEERLRRNDGAEREIGEIARAAGHAATLTASLLAFSRRQVLQPELVVVDHLLGNIDGLLRRTIGEHVTLDVARRAPAAAVEVERGGIEQVLINLVVNARDAIADRGSITLSTDLVLLGPEESAELGLAPGKYVRFDVADDGRGMDEETQARIFEPFFTTKPVGDGTGLGLSTAYSIVQRSAGAIGATSVVGEGTRFSVWLPARVAIEHSLSPARAATGGSGERILVVEDEEMVRAVLVESLELDGYAVIPAAGPDEAIAAFGDGGSFDLLITDLRMPGMSGRELAAALTATRPQLAVLFISGYTADVLADDSAAENGIAFLPKPFDLTTISSKVREVLAAAAAA